MKAHPRCKNLWKSRVTLKKIQRSHWELNTIEPREIIARKQSKTSQVFRQKLRGHERRATDICTDIRMLNTWPWNHSRIYWSIVYELLELGLIFYQLFTFKTASRWLNSSQRIDRLFRMKNISYPVRRSHSADDLDGVSHEEPSISAHNKSASFSLFLRNRVQNTLNKILRVVFLLEHRDGFS